MGYLIQKNIIKGFIEERRVNGVGVNYSINIQYIQGVGCKEEPDSGSFSINNTTGSERRYFTLTQTFDLGIDCNTSSLDIAEKPLTIKDRGTGPLPAKYKSLYSLLEGRANVVNDTKLSYPSDVSYKQVDAELTKTSIIFNLLQLFPQQLIALSPSNYVSVTSDPPGDPPLDEYGNPYQASACCIGYIDFLAIVRILSYDEQNGSTINVTGSRTAKTVCHHSIKCDGATPINAVIDPFTGKPLIYSCGTLGIRDKVFSASKLNNLEDGYADIPYDDRGELRVKNYGVKLGCCNGLNRCPDKFITSNVNFTFTYPRKFKIIKRFDVNDLDFDKVMEIALEKVFEKYGFDSDNIPVFKSCSCVTPIIQQTPTSTLM